MTRFQKLLMKRALLQAIAFPDHPFYPVALNRLFKIPAAHAYAGLQRRPPVYTAVGRRSFKIYFEGILEKMLPFPEQLFDPLAAFQPFCFFKCKFLFQDHTKIAPEQGYSLSN